MSADGNLPALSSLMLDGSDFFAPIKPNALRELVDDYDRMRANIDQVVGFFAGNLSGIVHYFIEGNRRQDNSRYSAISAGKIFERSGAVAALNAEYWQRALNLTDVYQHMPQARRSEWSKAIHDMSTPEFTLPAVVETMRDLMASRERFLAERVDGIFRALSGEHVTNAPEAFGKRMIIARIITCYGSVEHDRVGFINDLRVVIAKFMGRGEPRWNSSSALVDHARANRGQWQSIDGGALRLRVYKCGTAHMEVHPDIAWRLNSILAYLYPTAIPASSRRRPARASKTFAPIERLLPFAVIEVLSEVSQAREPAKDDWRDRWRYIPMTVDMPFREHPAEIRAEAARVLAYIGGVEIRPGRFQFDYEPGEVIGEIVRTGALPDQKSHQFYPTPESVAAVAYAFADIGPEHRVLEPSAGTGSLAAVLPQGRTTCVELSPLHCAVLRARGYSTIEGDFIAWADAQISTSNRFDRIVMNPPFANGRALQHVERAASLLASNGRIVAVLPASMRGNDVLPGWSHVWSDSFAGEFAGTGVSVAVVSIER